MRPGETGIVARFVVCVVDSWRWALSCGVVHSGGLFAGSSWWLVEPACGETQDQQLFGVSRGIWSDLEFAGTC